MSEDIKGKIRKLLAMTVANGATEDEAETAMRMAMGLMARHGIEQSQLGGEAPKAKRGKRIAQEFKKHQLLLASAAAHLYGCKIVFYGSMGKDGLEFIGRPDNIDVAEQTMFWLIAQVESLYRTSLPRGLPQSVRANYRRTFKDACAHRVQSRAYELMREVMSNDSAAQASTGSNALVVKGHFEKLLAESQAVMAQDPNVRIKQIQVKSGIGTHDGLRAGDKVQLRREIGR